MSLNLYMKTNLFKCNRDMAEYYHVELKKRGVKLREPLDADYMYILESTIDGQPVNFYMGKNDEESSPDLWQIWPQQKTSFLKKIFGKSNTEPEEKAKLLLEEITNKIEGVQGVEWAI